MPLLMRNRAGIGLGYGFKAHAKAAPSFVQATAKVTASLGVASGPERPFGTFALSLNMQSSLLRPDLGSMGTEGGLRATFALNPPQDTPLVRVLLSHLHMFFRRAQGDGCLTCLSTGYLPVQVES
jgi:hypothetical protein